MIRNLAALEAMRDSVFVAEVATGIIVDANPAAVALCGRSLADLRSLHYTILLAPENVERPQSGFLSAPQAQGPVEGTVLHKDGHRIPVEITSSHFIDPDGRRMLIAIFRDITGRKAGGEGLRHIEQTFRHVRELIANDVLRQSDFIQAALDNISDGVAACDSTGDLPVTISSALTA
jgi:PAS domain S-box-containing protein